MRPVVAREVELARRERAFETGLRRRTEGGANQIALVSAGG